MLALFELCRNFINPILNKGLLISFGVLYRVFHGIDACVSFGFERRKIILFHSIQIFPLHRGPILWFIHFDRNNALTSLPLEIGALNRLGIFDLHSNQVITYSSSSIHLEIFLVYKHGWVHYPPSFKL